MPRPDDRVTLTIMPGYASATGEHRYAHGSDGLTYWSPPVRRRRWTCPAGVEHRRYWRSSWRQGRDDRFQCEHTSVEVGA